MTGARSSDDVERSVTVTVNSIEVDACQSQLVDNCHRLRLVELLSQARNMVKKTSTFRVALRDVTSALAQVESFRRDFV